jgi:hypothetical protein
MRKLESVQLEVMVGGGPASYGAGLICGLAVAGTIIAGPVGWIAMGLVAGSACGFSMWHASAYDST